MIDELENLRPEVREAIREIAVTAVVSRPDLQHPIGAIRAELLRLANENFGMHLALSEHDALCEQSTTYRLRAEKAEAGLAALKARIAESPVYEIPLSKPKSKDGWARVIESVRNERSVRGKRVRLVVEE